MEELRAAGHEVLVVTAPFDTDYWAREREVWLRRNLGFKRSEVMSVSRKERVHGDVLVDDKVDNLVRKVEQDKSTSAVV